MNLAEFFYSTSIASSVMQSLQALVGRMWSCAALARALAWRCIQPSWSWSPSRWESWGEIEQICCACRSSLTQVQIVVRFCRVAESLFMHLDSCLHFCWANLASIWFSLKVSAMIFFSPIVPEMKSEDYSCLIGFVKMEIAWSLPDPSRNPGIP